MSAPPTTPVFSHIALQVSDLQRSTRFYATIIELSPLPEPFKKGRHSWFALGTQAQLHLIAGGANIPAFHIDHHLALSTPLFDRFVDRLKEAAVLFYDARRNEGSIHTRPDGVRQVFLQDPDGYWLEMNDEYPVPSRQF